MDCPAQPPAATTNAGSRPTADRGLAPASAPRRSMRFPPARFRRARAWRSGMGMTNAARSGVSALSYARCSGYVSWYGEGRKDLAALASVGGRHARQFSDRPGRVPGLPDVFRRRSPGDRARPRPRRIAHRCSAELQGYALPRIRFLRRRADYAGSTYVADYDARAGVQRDRLAADGPGAARGSAAGRAGDRGRSMTCTAAATKCSATSNCGWALQIW
jgi:hypothetical protein